MTQLWFNAWEKTTPHPVTKKPVKEIRIESEACASYDDAMQELEDYSDGWHRQGWSYFGTYCHELDANGKTTSVTFHDDLADELQSWIHQRDEDARAYREAGTLSASQLCNVGRAA